MIAGPVSGHGPGPWLPIAGLCVCVAFMAGCTRSRNAVGDSESLSVSAAPSARELFEQGVDYHEFIRHVDRREAMWLRNTAKGSVPPELVERVSRSRNRASDDASGRDLSRLHILAVAEYGCSDSANIVPYLSRFVDSMPRLDMRIVNSTVGQSLMEAHRTPDGRAATPTIVVLDNNFEQLGCLIERPRELQDWALANRSALTEDEFLTAKFAWYDEDLGRQSMEELVGVIENAGSELVNCGVRH